VSLVKLGPRTAGYRAATKVSGSLRSACLNPSCRPGSARSARL